MNGGDPCLHANTLIDLLHFFYKNIVFPVEDEYSYFSADFTLKYSYEYSWVMMHDVVDISVFECI